MKKYILSICLLLPMLIGCSGFHKNENSLVLTTPDTIIVDSRLLQPCQPLQPLPPQSNLDDVASSYITTIHLYGECSLKQDASIQALKQFSNQKDKND